MSYICNLGDSRAVLYRVTNKEKLAIELSYDHKPTRPDEKQRVLRAGGKIEKLVHDGVPVGPYRVWADDEGPGIAMTRTLGDLQAKKIGLISEPEVQHLELTRQDKFIVIGSDGVWDVMSSSEVCGFVV
jgi:integrin-linked kinase-associated serine/threonine phosphatase 2C